MTLLRTETLFYWIVPTMSAFSLFCTKIVRNEHSILVALIKRFRLPAACRRSKIFINSEEFSAAALSLGTIVVVTEFYSERRHAHVGSSRLWDQLPVFPVPAGSENPCLRGANTLHDQRVGILKILTLVDKSHSECYSWDWAEVSERKTQSSVLYDSTCRR